MEKDAARCDGILACVRDLDLDGECAWAGRAPLTALEDAGLAGALDQPTDHRAAAGPVALPLGVWLVDRVGFTAVFVAAAVQVLQGLFTNHHLGRFEASYWALSYDHGFVRRGLPGELLRLASGGRSAESLAGVAQGASFLARYAAAIQSQRGDYDGKVLSIRAEDLRSLSIIYDKTPGELTDQLIEWSVLPPEARPAP